jgi:DNA helicase II / ATP-dependent DNA helicase PcrA
MKNLNPAQTKAALHKNGPLLILAGAGAGKTKTIVERICNLIYSGVEPSSILAVTFTNKAASEMRERVAEALKTDERLVRPIRDGGSPFVSTFHALGVFIIKRESHRLGLPRHFSILDRGDSKSIIKDILKSSGYDPKQYDAGKILSIISREKGNAVSQTEYSEATSRDYFGQVVSHVWEKYDLEVRKQKALDFDDLLAETAKLLAIPEVRATYENMWSYIHVDEYQDTNIVQYKISKFLAYRTLNLCVVGDIDQNIYSWRGARLRNILDFERDYPGAEVIVLEENYRSTQTILYAANAIIEKNTFRKEKNLFTKNPTGEPISLYEGYDEISEAEFIATKVEGLTAGGVNPEEIAVLYRANFQSRALEEALVSYGVPYQLLGTKYFERKEVKDVLSYLRVSLEPSSLSDFKRAVNFPARGIGKVSLLKIFEGKSDQLPKGTREKFLQFEGILKKIRFAIDTLPPSQTIKLILKESGIEDELTHGKGEDAERLENVRELVSIAARYDSTPGIEGIESFLTQASLHSDQDDLETPIPGIRLMTIHASKGLEFEYVFITGLEDGLFPHTREVLPRPKNEDDEEERRLFYVAVTRAKKKLFLSYAQTRMIYGSRQVNLPSEFIYDIPDESVVKEEGTFGLLRQPLIKIDF